MTLVEQLQCIESVKIEIRMQSKMGQNSLMKKINIAQMCDRLFHSSQIFLLYIILIQMSRSTSYTGFSDRKSDKEQPSKVLLVCVYQTIIFELTNEQIFEKFNPFGAITKILIFEKGEVTKFFIEFPQMQHAVNAKNKLDGTKFFQNICKMNIYFSNFRNVDLRHQSSHGTDYEMMEEKKNVFVQNFDHLTKSTIQKNLNYLDDDILMRTFSPFDASSFTRSKTDNPKTLQEEIFKIKKQQEHVNMIEQEEVDKEIKLEMHSLLHEGEYRNSRSQKSIHSFNEPQKSKLSLNLNKELAPINNGCAISFDLKDWVPLRQVYNLFSNFGNIQSIIGKKQRLYIIFRSGYFAAVAMNYLAGMSLCGNHLNLRYVENHEDYIQRPMKYSESIYFDQSFDRFTSKRSITVNPPSETLHVSSIKKQNCNDASLRKIFGQYGYVERVKILMQSNEKNMALVKFSTMKESFEAISELHNKQFGGRKMQISFTKSKL